MSGRNRGTTMVPWKPEDDDLTNWVIIGKAKIDDPEHPGGIIVSKEGCTPRVAYWDQTTGTVKSLPLGVIHGQDEEKGK